MSTGSSILSDMDADAPPPSKRRRISYSSDEGTPVADVEAILENDDDEEDQPLAMRIPGSQNPTKSTKKKPPSKTSKKVPASRT